MGHIVHILAINPVYLIISSMMVPLFLHLHQSKSSLSLQIEVINQLNIFEYEKTRDEGVGTRRNRWGNRN